MELLTVFLLPILLLVTSCSKSDQENADLVGNYYWFAENGEYRESYFTDSMHYGFGEWKASSPPLEYEVRNGSIYLLGEFYAEVRWISDTSFLSTNETETYVFYKLPDSVMSHSEVIVKFASTHRNKNFHPRNDSAFQAFLRQFRQRADERIKQHGIERRESEGSIELPDFDLTEELLDTTSRR